MDLNLIAVIVGIVEGLTEFLPVSSTGHMIIVGHVLGFEGQLADVFDVFVQLGAILSRLDAASVRLHDGVPAHHGSGVGSSVRLRSARDVLHNSLRCGWRVGRDGAVVGG